MANALAVRDEINLDELQRTARMLAASGYFSNDKREDVNVQIAQLATKIMAGRELGYGPFASVQGIHVIQGKPQVSANLMAAAVKSHPRYDYRVRKMDADGVRIEFFENGESIGVSEFTREDAAKAGTQNINKFPRNMLFARALSNGVRWFCPDVFHGQSVYVEGELEDTGNDTPAVVVVDKATGEVVEGEYTPVTPATNGNGNGHKPPTAEAPKFPFERVDGQGVHINAIEWAMTQNVFNARQHAENSYKKLSGEMKYHGPSATREQTDALLSAWVEKVNAKAAEMQSAPADNPFDAEPVAA